MITCVFMPVMLLIVIFTGLMAYKFVADDQEDLLIRNTETVMKLTEDYLDARLYDTVSVIMGIYNSKELGNIVTDIEDNDGISPSRYIEIQNLLDSYFSKYYSIINNITIAFRNRNEVINKGFYNTTAYDIEWQDGLKANMFTLVWHGPGTESPISVDDAKHKAGSAQLFGHTRDGLDFVIIAELTGSLFSDSVQNLYLGLVDSVVIEDDGIFTPCGNEEIDGFIPLLSKISRSSESMGVIKSNDHVVIYDSLKYSDWHLAVCIERSSMLSGINAIRNLTMIMILVGSILSIGISLYFGWLISRPINEFAGKVNNLDLDNLDQEAFSDINSLSPEINILSASMVNLISRIKALISDIENREKENAKIQNSLLLAQINPHFLYNTLYAIANECALGENEEASNMLYELSAFFRTGLSAGREVLTLKEELSHVENYLSLIRRSFPYNLSYSFEISPEAESCLIPKMTLQPIVENCFKHGLKQKRADGNITITATVKDFRLLITVRDDGIGIPADRLAEINSQIEERKVKDKGFGMINVMQRLRSYFGQDSSLVITSETDCGTEVVIDISYKKELEEVE